MLFSENVFLIFEMACLLQMINIVKKLNPSTIKPITFGTNRAILLSKLKVISLDKIVLICLKRTNSKHKWEFQTLFVLLSYFSKDNQLKNLLSFQMSRALFN